MSFLKAFCRIAALLSMVFLCECKNNDITNEVNMVPVITTEVVSSVSLTSAVSGGNITSNGGSAITARGVCWGTNTNPTISGSKSINGTGIGNFVSHITGLSPNTNYYVRAYATNSAGTGYGNSVYFTSQKGGENTVTDFDGNVYNTVIINNKVWMLENLKVKHYRNGDPIPNVTGAAQWAGLTSGAYCNYDNNDSDADTYGRLYNWYAANDSRNIAPEGWHIPTDADWAALLAYLGGGDNAGAKLKETGTLHWENPNVGATNQSGFTALGVGERDGFGGGFAFRLMGSRYWTSTSGQSNPITGVCYMVFNYAIYCNRNEIPKQFGVSIRCVKD